MTRLIERWFPCQEVSDNSRKGWGSGNAEKELFPWFAARPLVQAKAAVLCSLLPWPEGDKGEQERLQKLVQSGMEGYDAAHGELVAELNKYYPDGASLLDSFSGRAMIPLEAARLEVRSMGLDYSPVATLGGSLLADYPMRDWSQEPPLPYDDYESYSNRMASPRLLCDVEYILDLIGRRYESEMDLFYPIVNGKRPWGYLWAITLPCVNCGRRFPITGSYELRKPGHKENDPGQSYYIETGGLEGEYKVIVHEGSPKFDPTLIKKKGSKGRIAICLFCDHVHAHETHTRLMGDGESRDALLVVADIDSEYGKKYREPSQVEIDSIKGATNALNNEPSFTPDLPAVPDEKALGSTGPRDYARYGYHTYGDFCNTRQTLGLIKLSRIINDICLELLNTDISSSYVSALSGYASSVLCRKIRMSTRGAMLQVGYQKIGSIIGNGPPVPFGSDYFETGCGEGPGTWVSLVKSTVRTLRKQLDRVTGLPATIQQGTATNLLISVPCMDAVVTDPPYADMVEYSDGSDIFYVWLKRALAVSHQEFGISSNCVGVQEKKDEAVVKMTWKRSGDHRTPYHYYSSITRALYEARRVLKPGGVVSIIFGHDDPEVWKDFLSSIDNAGLILTGSWPARTEHGSQMGKINIETTLTLACKPADPDRPEGQMLEVDREVKQEILDRLPLWQKASLALPDQRMASYGPAMEVVGRYSQICDKAGRSVSLDSYLAKARRYVEEAAEIRIGNSPLEVFDPHSHFALFWTYMYGRTIVPGSEERWLRLGWEMEEEDTEGLLKKVGKGFRLIYAREVKQPRERNAVIDVALAVAGAGKSIRDIATILADSDMVENELLWDSISHLAQHVTESDNDGDVWTWAVRNRSVIIDFSKGIKEDRIRKEEERHPDPML